MVMKIVVVMVTHLGISVYVIMTSNYGDGCGIMECKMDVFSVFKMVMVIMVMVMESWNVKWISSQSLRWLW